MHHLPSLGLSREYAAEKLYTRKCKGEKLLSELTWNMTFMHQGTAGNTRSSKVGGPPFCLSSVRKGAHVEGLSGVDNLVEPCSEAMGLAE